MSNNPGGGLQQSGIEFIAQNLGDFLQSLTQAQKAIVMLGSATKGRVEEFTQLSETMDKAMSEMTKMVNSITRVSVAQAKADVATQEAVAELARQKTVADQMAHINELLARETQKTAAATARAEAVKTKAIQATLQEQLKLQQIQATNAGLEGQEKLEKERTAQSHDKLQEAIERTKQKTISLQIAQVQAAQAAKAHAASITQITKSVLGFVSGLSSAASSSNVLVSAFGKLVGPTSSVAGILQAVASGLAMIGASGGTVVAVVSGLAVALAPLVALVTALVAAVMAAQAAIDLLRKAFDALLSVINFLLTPIRDLFENIRQALVVTAGMMLRDAIEGLANRVRDLGAAMMDGAVSAQTLTIKMQGLLAAALQTKFGLSDFGEGMKMAAGYAEKMMNWVNDIALHSPFSRDQIANITNTNLALGFTIGQTQKLVKAAVDWGSGMAMDNDHIQQMMYNFGQIATQGKLTGQELRDAARGGLIPWMDLVARIGEKMGWSKEQIKKAIEEPAESGIKPWQFFNEFVAMTEERFNNAGRRMSRTWEGVTNNIQDFIQTVLGADILKPVLDEVAAGLADLLEMMLSPEFRAQAKFFGTTLVYAFHTIKRAMDDLWLAVGRVAEKFGITEISAAHLGAAVEVAADMIASGINWISQQLQNFANGTSGEFEKAASDAFDWGFELIENFVNGLLEAIDTVVVGAMNALTNLLHFWLKPNSPPRIYPDIDKDGSKTAATYLEGFAQVNAKQALKGFADKVKSTITQAGADWGAETFVTYLKTFSAGGFDAMSSIQGTLQGALDAMVGLGRFGEYEDDAKKSANEVLKELTKGLAEAVATFEETGTIDTGFLDKLKEDTGEFGAEIVDLTTKQLALVAGLKEQVAAEKALKAAQDALAASFKKVQTSINEYNTMLRMGATKADLRAKLKLVNADEWQLSISQKQKEAAEERKKLADEALEPLKEAVELQEKLVQQMIELAKLYATGLKPGTAPLPETPPEDDAEDLPESLFDQLQKDLEAAMKAIKAKIEEKLKEIWDTIQKWWNEHWTPFYDDVTGAWNNLATTIGELFKPVATTVNPIWNSIEATAKSVMNSLEWWVNDRLTKANAWWKQYGGDVDEILKAIWKQLGNIANWNIATDNPIWKTLKDLYDDFKILDDIAVLVGEALGVVAALLRNDIPDARQHMNAVFADLANIGLQLADIKSDIELFLISLVIQFVQWKEPILAAFLDMLFGFGPTDIHDQAALVTGALIDGLIAGISGGNPLVQAALNTLVDSYMIAPTKKRLDIKSPSGVFFDIGKDIVQGLIDGIESMTFQAGETWRQFWDDLWAKVDSTRLQISTTVSSNLSGVTEAITSFGADAKEKWDGIWDGMKSKVTTIMGSADDGSGIVGGVSKSMSSVYDDIVGTLNSALAALGAQQMIDNFKHAATTLVDTMSQGVRESIDDFVATFIGDATHKGLLQSALDAIRDRFADLTENTVSNNPFIEFGKWLILSIITGVNAMFDNLWNAILNAVLNAIGNVVKNITGDTSGQLRGFGGLNSSAAMYRSPATVAAPASYRTAALNIGSVTINNGMDEAAFEARVLNIMGRAL